MSEVQEENLQEESQETFIGDLLQGEFPAQADPEPVEGLPQEEPKQGEEEPAGKDAEGAEGEVKEGEVSEVKDAAVKTFEYRGKQYTVEQLVQEGILEDVIQTARQFPTIQQKYVAMLEKEKAEGEVQAQPQQAQAPQQAQLNPDQIVNACLPEARRIAEAGYLEPEIVEAFPKLAAALVFHRDLIYDVRKAVQLMVNNHVETQQVQARQTFMNYLDGICMKVSEQGEHFQLLKDKKAKEGFYGYLGTLNAPADTVDEAFIRRQWIAYNAEAMTEAAALAVKNAKETQKEQQRNALGEGQTTRATRTKDNSKEKTQDDKLRDSFLEGEWPNSMG